MTTDQQFYKFLDDNLRCYYPSCQVFYPSPVQCADGSWLPGQWITVKDAKKDGEPCGVGLHLMKIPNPMYGRYTGNAYLAEGRDLLGEDKDKARFRSIRLLRPLDKSEIFKPSANLRSANLESANLRYANLESANLRYANLESANLRYANLESANLESANLRYANLWSANLWSANLTKGSVTKEQLKDAVNADLINWCDPI